LMMISGISRLRLVFQILVEATEQSVASGRRRRSAGPTIPTSAAPSCSQPDTASAHVEKNT
jgi:hypothetical protein